MQRRKQVCGGSEARLSSVIWHNEKVWNFHDVSGALAVCVRAKSLHKHLPSTILQTLRRCSASTARTENSPKRALVQGTDGNFYGTTVEGGANCPPLGCGTIFKITPSGTLTTLHSFGGTDGTEPHGLVQATNGNFYGTTSFGGANSDGTVFEITPSGTLTTLASFDVTNGQAPEAGLIQATDGNFYGTTYKGGANTSLLLQWRTRTVHK